ncbi:uncharacterized protein LOC116201858 isoform X2 [Punica granatum]|uniref:Uncharacterized protein LOC116201858 isoform X2 n=1 Tax=Punica granatum TaxID=22663 RepID=A0A218WZV6_PUNGR|nr:uncharacterized protein LOC116201858 isoform X2 [Punica granatum]OWM78277.1 hypothetical protein CDL15_Pgr015096 [Punica granatum]
MGGCLVCCSKPKLISSAGPLPEGQESRGQDFFWSTSVSDMDYSAAQSQGSISSISTSNQTLYQHGGLGPSGTPESVNHGLLLWNQTRQHWLSNKKNKTRPRQVREPKLSWNVTYESLLGSNKPFPQPVPLSEMVDFLVNVWEQEGMYD